MKTKRSIFAIGVFLLISVLSDRLVAQEDMTHEELVRRAREMFDGVSASDDSAWQRYVADDCLFFDEKGRSLDKATLTKEVTSLPEGYRVTFKILNPQSRIVADTAILSYDIDEDLWIFGQSLGADFHSTDTWVRRDGKWQILAIQIFRYYGDPAPGPVDPTRLPQYEGVYELAPGIRAKVFVENGNLYYQRGDGEKQTLIPEATDIFFRKGVEGRILFHYGKDGKVNELVSRRNHEDLLWKRVP